jgi:hypothetical protein
MSVDFGEILRKYAAKAPKASMKNAAPLFDSSLPAEALPPEDLLAEKPPVIDVAEDGGVRERPSPDSGP